MGCSRYLTQPPSLGQALLSALFRTPLLRILSISGKHFASGPETLCLTIDTSYFCFNIPRECLMELLWSDMLHALLNPLPSTLGATWLPLPRMLPYSLNIFWRAQWLCVFSLLFPPLSSLNQAWGDEMPVQDSWRNGHRHTLLWFLLTVRQTAAGGATPFTTRTCLELSYIRSFSSHSWDICFLPPEFMGWNHGLLISTVGWCCVLYKAFMRITESLL